MFAQTKTAAFSLIRCMPPPSHIQPSIVIHDTQRRSLYTDGLCALPLFPAATSVVHLPAPRNSYRSFAADGNQGELLRHAPMSPRVLPLLRPALLPLATFAAATVFLFLLLPEEPLSPPASSPSSNLSPPPQAPPFPEIKSAHSLVAKHVTKEKWDKLGGLTTKTSGFTLGKVSFCIDK